MILELDWKGSNEEFRKAMSFKFAGQFVTPTKCRLFPFSSDFFSKLRNQFSSRSQVYFRFSSSFKMWTALSFPRRRRSNLNRSSSEPSTEVGTPICDLDHFNQICTNGCFRLWVLIIVNLNVWKGCRHTVNPSFFFFFFFFFFFLRWLGLVETELTFVLARC